jgi:hypothetical protein
VNTAEADCHQPHHLDVEGLNREKYREQSVENNILALFLHVADLIVVTPSNFTVWPIN